MGFSKKKINNFSLEMQILLNEICHTKKNYVMKKIHSNHFLQYISGLLFSMSMPMISFLWTFHHFFKKSTLKYKIIVVVISTVKKYIAEYLRHNTHIITIIPAYQTFPSECTHITFCSYRDGSRHKLTTRWEIDCSYKDIWVIILHSIAVI